MMRTKIHIQLKAKTRTDRRTKLNALFVFRNVPAEKQKIHYPEHYSEIERFIRSGDFTADEDSVFTYYTADSEKSEKMILAGLGNQNQFEADVLRRSAARIIRQASQSKNRNLIITYPDLSELPYMDDVSVTRLIAEGIMLGHYSYDEFKTGQKPNAPVHVTIEVPKINQGMQRGLEKGLIISQSVCFARDLGNTPPSVCTPSHFANKVKKNVSGYKLVCSVLSKHSLRRMKMNGILSVSAGSHEAPCMLQIEYKPAKPINKKPFVFVGKGITFDSGGLNLKTGANMDQMKMDMTGGAAVAGILKAASDLRLSCHLIGLIPLAENMPGNRAFKPGDIIRMHNGSTVEIMNTDAEGRLLLADAISYAQTFRPDVIIDIATLTGACVVAIGPTAAGMLGTSAEWKERITSASVKTAERVWELPIWKENESLIKSVIADYKNTGNRWGGAITAAAFLKVFAGKTPWIHLDIAGPAYAEDDHAYCAKHHASGFGIRLILEILMKL